MKILEQTVVGRPRTWLAFGFGILFAILFFLSIKDLVLFVLHPENRRYNSHIVFIPFVSGYLLNGKRKEVAEHESFSAGVGIPVLLGALILYGIGRSGSIISDHQTAISLQAISAVIFLAGSFIAIYGVAAFRFARFPFLFLLFVAPLPTGMMDGALHVLQVCSTEVSYLLFKISGIPIFRDGFIFSLPGLSIEVAKACSGMRSTITLFILTVLGGHLFLRSIRRKIVLALSTFPITIIGNSLRIVGLTMLGIYVDRAYIDGASLPHLRGGWLFFLVDLAVAAGVAAALKRGDKNG